MAKSSAICCWFSQIFPSLAYSATEALPDAFRRQRDSDINNPRLSANNLGLLREKVRLLREKAGLFNSIFFEKSCENVWWFRIFFVTLQRNKRDGMTRSCVPSIASEKPSSDPSNSPSLRGRTRRDGVTRCSWLLNILIPQKTLQV